MQGYARDDGLFDVEGHLTDCKPVDFQINVGPRRAAGEPIHEMWIRLTIDKELVVREVVAATDHAPYLDCQSTPPTLASLVGLRIGGGWKRAVRERLGGTQSCTHLMELLGPMATTAVQSLVTELREFPLQRSSGRSLQIDSCYSMAATRRAVALRWPEYYEGPRDAAGRPVDASGQPYLASEEGLHPSL